MQVNVTITVNGLVQGVFFRDFVVEQAKRLGITGYVSNMSDGSVYAEAEGESESIAAFVEQCKFGPSRARVDSINVQSGSLKYLKDFAIKRVDI